MHILLLILKIIGGLLLFLLLLLILILLIVLLVPVRYRFSGEKKEEGLPRARAEVSWLMSLVCFQGAYGPEGLTYGLWVAWKKLLDSGGDQERAEDQEDLDFPDDFLEEEKDSDQSPDHDGGPPADQTGPGTGPEQSQAPDQVAEDSQNQADQTAAVSGDQADQTEDRKEDDSGPQASSQDQPSAEEDSSGDQEASAGEDSSGDQEAPAGESISGEDQAPDQDIIDKISTKLDAILDKLQEKKEFLDDKLKFGEELLNTFPLDVYLPIIQATLYKLLNHVRPRSIKGQGCYGFEDPYTTGTVTSYTAMLYPFYAGSLDLTPDFTRKILTGDLEGEGRIRLGYLLWILIWLLLKKEVRFAICYVLKLRKKPRQPSGQDRKAKAQE